MLADISESNETIDVHHKSNILGRAYRMPIPPENHTEILDVRESEVDTGGMGRLGRSRSRKIDQMFARAWDRNTHLNIVCTVVYGGCQFHILSRLN